MSTDEVLIIHLVKDDIRQESLCGAPILHNKDARGMKFCAKCHNIVINESLDKTLEDIAIPIEETPNA